MGGSRTHLLLIALIMVGVVLQAPVVSRHDRVHDATRRISTDHLDITAYVRDGAGSSFSLVLDIDPRERVYVYAPGAAEYRAIAVTVAPTPFLQFQSPKFSTPNGSTRRRCAKGSRSIESRSV